MGALIKRQRFSSDRVHLVRALKGLVLELPSEEDLVKRYTTPEWAPTPRQARFLGLISLMVSRGLSVKAVCNALGYPVAEVAGWMEDENFAGKYKKAWQLLLEREMVGVISSLLAQAQSGDVKAAKLCLEMAGVYVPPKYRVDIQTTVTLESVLHESRRFLEARIVPDSERSLNAKDVQSALPGPPPSSSLPGEKSLIDQVLGPINERVMEEESPRREE